MLLEKQAGISSDLFNHENVAIVDKLLENKCISKKQHIQIFLNVMYKNTYSNISIMHTHIFVCIP